MIRGRVFSEINRIQARKSELEAKSRSYAVTDQKVGDTAGQTPRIRTESPGKGGASAEPLLKPS